VQESTFVIKKKKKPTIKAKNDRLEPRQMRLSFPNNNLNLLVSLISVTPVVQPLHFRPRMLSDVGNTWP
jgi:hypothetical protein